MSFKHINHSNSKMFLFVIEVFTLFFDTSKLKDYLLVRVTSVNVMSISHEHGIEISLELFNVFLYITQQKRQIFSKFYDLLTYLNLNNNEKHSIFKENLFITRNSNKL